MAAYPKPLVTLRLPSTTRLMSWAEFGSPTGRPLIYLHGTPSCRLELFSEHQVLYDRNIRLIAPDRPGFGRSEPAPGRTVGSYAADIQALVAHLGLSEYIIVGSSGGGPYALSCARYIHPEDGLRGVSLISSPAPNPCGLKGMSWGGAILVRLNRWVPRLVKYLEHHFTSQSGLREDFTGPLEEWTPGPAMRAVAEAKVMASAKDGGYRDALVAAPWRLDLLAEEEMETHLQEPDAWPEDFHLCIGRWDFGLEDITFASRGKRPLVIWVGTEDTVTPVHMGRWIAERVRGSQLREVKGATHSTGIDYLDCCEELFQMSGL
ncbi:hypothetical protein ACJ41O_003817 [Fusarium nematophilum]